MLLQGWAQPTQAIACCLQVQCSQAGWGPHGCAMPLAACLVKDSTHKSAADASMRPTQFLWSRPLAKEGDSNSRTLKKQCRLCLVQSTCTQPQTTMTNLFVLQEQQPSCTMHVCMRSTTLHTTHSTIESTPNFPAGWLADQHGHNLKGVQVPYCKTHPTEFRHRWGHVTDVVCDGGQHLAGNSLHMRTRHAVRQTPSEGGFHTAAAPKLASRLTELQLLSLLLRRARWAHNCDPASSCPQCIPDKTSAPNGSQCFDLPPNTAHHRFP